MLTLLSTVIGLLLISKINVVSGYAKGPPSQFCLAPIPRHSKASVYAGQIEAKISDSGFQMTASSTAYVKSAEYKITISPKTNDNTLMGFVLVAQRTSNEMYELLGTWSACSYNGTTAVSPQIQSVSPGSSNCVSHNENSRKYGVVCTWKAPSTENEGNIRIRATIVTSFDTFFVGDEVIITSSVPVLPTITGSSTSVPETGDCGKTKSCILYPYGCVSGCTHMVSYWPVANRIQFQNFAPDNEYMAVGISNDNEMGDDLYVFAGRQSKTTETNIFSQYCDSNGMVSPVITNLVNNKVVGRIMKAPGNMVSEFDLPQNGGYQNLNWNADKTYVFMAVGNSVPKMLSFYGHKERPLRSYESVNLNAKEFSVTYFEGREKVVKIHETLATLGFLLIWPIGTFIAAHLRPNMNRKVTSKLSLWFIVHVILVLLGFALGIAALILILVAKKGWNDYSSGHGSVAVVMLIFGLGNIISGALRPEPSKQPNRSIFHFFHRGGGYLARICSVGAFWLAITMSGTPGPFLRVSVIIIGVWTGLELLYFVGFWLIRTLNHQCYLSQFAHKARYSLVGGLDKSRNISHCGIVGVIVYALCVVALTTAFLVMIWVN